MVDTVRTGIQVAGTAIAGAQIMNDPETKNVIIQVIIIIATWAINMLGKKKGA